MYDPHHSLCRGGVKRRFANLGDLCGYLHFSGFIIQVLDMSGFTHFDEAGQAHMVGVAEKSETRRIARAAGKITMQPATLSLILEGGAKKGDVIGVARIAAIQASKRASELIPLCHPLALTKVGVEFNVDKPNAAIECIVTAETLGRTGVEMEALTAVSVGLLTIYDMCKAVDRGMQVDGIRLLEKQGGKSGHWVAAV